MASLNPFRVSFDRPLGERERTRARVTAVVFSCVAIFLGATGLVALVKVSTDAIGWSDAGSHPHARILATGGRDPSGKEERKPESVAEGKSARMLDTTGSAASNKAEPSSAEAAGEDLVASVPIPVPAPERPVAAPTETSQAALESAAAQPSRDSKPRISRREQRRALQRERRQEVRSARANRVRAQAQARRERRERILRRWNEYSSPVPFFGMVR